METSFIMQTVYIEKKEESTAKVLRGKPEDDIFLPEYDKFILPVILWLAWSITCFLSLQCLTRQFQRLKIQ